MKAYGRSWNYNVYDCQYCLYWKGKKKGCVYPDGCCCPVEQKPARRNGIEQVYETKSEETAVPVSECDGCPYRIEARETMSIKLEDEDAEVAPVPAGKVGHIIDPEMDLLSVILSDFNDMFGNINWNDADNVRRQILEIPAMVSRDEKYQNAMKNSDKQNARMESERALQQVIFDIMADNMELFKQFQDNPSFKKWLADMVFNLTYNPEGKPYVIPGVGTSTSISAQ